MTYKEAITYLFNVAPLFQNIGQGAYKEGLSNTLALDEHFGHAHRKYKTIHVAGTNGKGSCCHTLAAILQHAGYKVGLYTSPHLKDFRERIRVNGVMIPKQRVVDFVQEERSFFEPLSPSFFELTTALAFTYFEEEKVDIAVIEVGLGGRLDCTNIISPLLSVITNISFDHVQFLGDTLEKIAREKAGIIKPLTPVVIGETNGHDSVKNVFLEKSHQMNAPICFAEEEEEVASSEPLPNGGRKYITRTWGEIEGELGGLCQEKNTRTILAAIRVLREKEFNIRKEDVIQGFAHVCSTTGLMGRWQILAQHPLVICDTGHNPGGLQYISQQLANYTRGHVRIIMGMVADKDVNASLRLLPKNALYYFTQAKVKRAMSASEIASLGKAVGICGNIYPSPVAAYTQAREDSSDDDLIYIGGSTFIVADILTSDIF